ncbi:MAG: hypothetical protein Q8M73_06220 [Actinomycetota bacterium]|nr:hypothetical protein [Actinomycetota bacterium]
MNAPSYAVDLQTAGELDAWTDAELALLIEEGRRQFDYQRSSLAEVRGRAQFLLTTCLALLAGFLAIYSGVARKESNWTLGFWIAGIAVLALCMMGASSVVVNAREMGFINSKIFSKAESPRTRSLAQMHLDWVAFGEDTNATQITIFQSAVFLALLSSLLLAVAWLQASQ